MRLSTHLTHATASSSSSSRAVVSATLGKGRTRSIPKQPAVSSLLTPRPNQGGPQAAMQLIRLGRVFVPASYLPDASSRDVSGATKVSPVWRRWKRYEPHASLLQSYIERGFTDMDALLFHPEAPSPMELLLSVMRHRTPCLQLTQMALAATIDRPRHTFSAGAASYALQTVYHILRNRCLHLYDNASVRAALCRALVSERLFSDAMDVLQGMPDSWIAPGLWRALIEAAAEGKCPHSQLLWRLLTLSPVKTPGEGRVVRTGQRVPEQLRKGTDIYSRRMGVKSFSMSGEEDVNRPLKGTDIHESGDVVTFSPFEVRPASIVRITREGEQLEWCQLSAGEVVYAEQHYRALQDLRGWGQGLLRPYKGDRWGEGIIYGLDARLASRLMLRANVSFYGQASPLIALHILRRHIRSCHALKRLSTRTAANKRTRSGSLGIVNLESNQLTASGSLPTEEPPDVQTCNPSHPGDANAVHPSPFLLFFKIIRETRDVLSGGGEVGATVGYKGASEGVLVAGLPMTHWELVWRYFQTLNRECPEWHIIIPEEAGDLSLYVIDVLCRGADPWMTLNVARAVSSRHIVDGLDMSLWLLHRLDPSHHPEEAREVTRKVFHWLLNDVGVHLQPQLHRNLIPAARVLVRLGLQDELKQLYNGVLDNVYMFTEDFRAEFLHVMTDLVCPSCSSILSVQDVYTERVCSICLTIVPAKKSDELPSFQLSNEHIARLREKRKIVRFNERKRLHESIYRWSKGDDGCYGRGTKAVVTGSCANTLSFLPFDASSMFKREILTDAAPFIPGVPLEGRNTPFLPEVFGMDVAGSQGSDSFSPSSSSCSTSSFDIYAAMEESSRRLQLQEAARRYTLAQRGVASPVGHCVAFPSPVATGSLSTLPASRFLSEEQLPGCLMPSIRIDGPWTCVWCHEQNTVWGSRTQCSACGAETGPAALWRQFAYATSTGDIMEEIRARIANSMERSVDAVVAGYMLMVYRRAFLLRATPHDAERIQRLIQRLCQLHERVLAGYVYMRFVPASARSKDNTLVALAHLFGCTEAEYAGLAAHRLGQNDSMFFEVVFTPLTCKVCFGQHEWKTCPIITRDFSTTKRTTISMSPEEKQETVLRQLKQAVETAVQRGAESSQLVVSAYTAFVKSHYRELFAEVHSQEVNCLSVLLSRYRQFRRAAFVLCHVPLQLRDDKAYMAMVPYFNVLVEDAQELLKKRSPLGVEDATHPNFVQVALTCCMCLDERHASFECPRLLRWVSEIVELSTLQDGTSPTSTSLVDVGTTQELSKRLRAQVDGWTSAGPERLHAFYRFLLQRVDDFQKDPYDALEDDDADTDTCGSASKVVGPALCGLQLRRLHMADPIIYAINKTISKLAAANQRKSAYRLYARAPVTFVSRNVTSTILRMSGYSEEGIRTLTSGDGEGVPSSSLASEPTTLGLSSEAARSAAVPMRSCCLLCFDSDHTFFDCPELTAQPAVAAKLGYVAVHVGGIRSGLGGVQAAAAYVYHTYNLGQLTSDLLRAHPSLVQSLLRLVRRCFACGFIGIGVRLLRRLPVEMVPPVAPYTDLWRAAGLGEDVVASRQVQLQALFAAEGLQPRMETPPTRQTYSNRFISGLSHVLHDDLCRHCYQHGHTLSTCSVFHAEVNFGRDYVAAYRMSMMSEQLDRDWRDAYLLKLVDFFFTHRVFMPYHIVGVSGALNAIAAMWSFRGEPGIAIRHVLNIPAAYRRKQTFRHILHSLRVPVDDVNHILSNVYFSPDGLSSPTNKPGGNAAFGSTSGCSATERGDIGGGVVAQHLLMPRPAIRDVAMATIFSQFPKACAALEESGARMEVIRRRNVMHRIMKKPEAERVNMGSWSVEAADCNATLSTASQSSVSSVCVSPRPVQCGDIATLREDFDSILTELEVAVGMKLGSRHVLFTSDVDILAAVGIPKAAEGRNERPREPVVTSMQKPTFCTRGSSTPSAARSLGVAAQNGTGRHSVPDEEPEIVTVFGDSASEQSGLERGGGRHHQEAIPDGVKPPSSSQGGRQDGSGGREAYQRHHTQQHYRRKDRHYKGQHRRHRDREGDGGSGHNRT